MLNIYDAVRNSLDFSQRHFALRRDLDVVEIEPLSAGRQYMMKAKKIGKRGHNHYIHLSEQDMMIVNALREGKSLDDISLDFFLNHSLLIDDYLEHFIEYLYRHQFLEPHYVNVRERVAKKVRDYKKAKKNIFGGASNVFSFVKGSWSFAGIDPFIERLYQRWGHLFFEMSAQKIMWSMMGISLMVIPFLLAFREMQIFTAHDSVILGLVQLYILKMILTSLHELGHAFAVKHYKREIIGGGVMSQMGMINFFVDTTDTLMCSKKERIVVMLAGIYANCVVLAVMTFVTLFFNVPFLNDLFIKVFVLTMMSLFINLNPLLYYDGYYVLTDLLNYPHLREEALKVFRELLPRIQKKDFSFAKEKKEFWFVLYALASIVWTVGTLFFMLSLLGRRLWMILREILLPHSWWIEILVVVFGMLLILPMFLSFGFFVVGIVRKWGRKLNRFHLWQRGDFRTITIFILPFILFIWPMGLLEMLSLILCSVALSGLLFILLPLWRQKQDFPLFFYQLLFIPLLLLPRYPLPLEIGLMTIVFFLCGWSLFKIKKSLFGYLLVYWLLAMGIAFGLKIVGYNSYRPLLVFHLTGFVYLYVSLIWENLGIVSAATHSHTRMRGETGTILIGDRAKTEHLFFKIRDAIFDRVRFLYGDWLYERIKNKVNIKDDKYVREEFPTALRMMKSDLEKILSATSVLGQDVGKRWMQQILDHTYWIEREIFEEYLGNGVGGESGKGGSLIPQNERAAFLQQIPLFSDFSESETLELMEHFHLREYKVGEILIEEGSSGDEFYILLSGMVRVYRREMEEGNNLAILGKGDIFGERHLYLGEPRNASISAITDGTLLYMERDDFNELLEKGKTFRQKIEGYIQSEFKFSDFLKTIPLFHQMPIEKIKTLCRAFKFSRYCVGEMIIKQGDVGDSFYIIKEGQVDILVGDNVIAKMEKGGFFGEMALFKDSPRTASVKTLTETVVLVLDREHFQSILKNESMLEKITTRRIKENE